ncbi:MAG TPA: hypothetical protein VF362_03125 [Demequinaceae bacterium]
MKRMALAATLGLVLVGCGPPPDFGPVSVYDPHGLHYEATIFEGTIHITAGCMTVHWQGPDVVLLFPSDEVMWDPKAAAFTYGGRAYADGDAISLEAIVDFGRTAGSVPEACPPSVRVYVPQAGLD